MNFATQKMIDELVAATDDPVHKQTVHSMVSDMSNAERTAVHWQGLRDRAVKLLTDIHETAKFAEGLDHDNCRDALSEIVAMIKDRYSAAIED